MLDNRNYETFINILKTGSSSSKVENLIIEKKHLVIFKVYNKVLNNSISSTLLCIFYRVFSSCY